MMPPEALRFAELGHRLMDSLEALPQPVIAAVNGFALGGGMELAMSCDILLASENARFGQPEVNIGVMPGFGGSQRLPRRVPFGVAAEILLSGDNITAADALRIGLVNRVLPLAELITEAKNWRTKWPVAPRWPSPRPSKRFMRRDRRACRRKCAERQLFQSCSRRQTKKGMGAFCKNVPPATPANRPTFSRGGSAVRPDW